MEGSFSQRVWELATSIPPGYVTSYGALAKAAGGTALAARSITSILGKAPNQAAIPYHRIIYADGRVWFDPKHEAKRRQLYKREGLELDQNNRIKDVEEHWYDFDHR